MTNFKQKLLAIKLRKQGLSYETIAKIVSVSKSTSHLWLKGIKLNSKAITRLKLSQANGRLKGFKTIKQKALNIDQQIFKSARAEVHGLKITKSISKLLCAFLYWGEGEKSKNKIAFTNSDPVMVKAFLKLFRNSFNLNELKFSAFLHLHSYHNQAKQIAFWSRICSIPKNKIHVYNKVSFGTYKKLNYPGCISIRYSDYKLAKEIYYIYTLFSKRI